MDSNTEKKYGGNSSITPPYREIHFYPGSLELSKIPFDLDNLDRIDGNIWSPAEKDLEFMSQEGFDEAVKDAKRRRDNLIFTNTLVNYDSCDCGGGYPCNHGDFPYEIEIRNKEGNVEHVIEIYDKGLELDSMDTTLSIYGLKNFTYADFYRFCQLCDITLESKFILK